MSLLASHNVGLLELASTLVNRKVLSFTIAPEVNSDYPNLICLTIKLGYDDPVIGANEVETLQFRWYGESVNIANLTLGLVERSDKFDSEVANIFPASILKKV